MYPGPDAVPSLREYARTMYADAKSYEDKGTMSARFRRASCWSLMR